MAYARGQPSGFAGGRGRAPPPPPARQQQQRGYDPRGGNGSVAESGPYEGEEDVEYDEDGNAYVIDEHGNAVYLDDDGGEGGEEDGGYDDDDGGGTAEGSLEPRLHPSVQVDEAGGLIMPLPMIYLEDLPEVASTGGFLHKKGGKGSSVFGFRSWTEVFMRLESLDLLVYAHEPPPLPAAGDDPAHAEPQPQPLQIFNIDSKTTVHPGDPSKQHKNRNVKFDFEVVNGAGETLTLYCETEDEANEWMDVVEYVAEKIEVSEAVAANPYLPAEEHEYPEEEQRQLPRATRQHFVPGQGGSSAGGSFYDEEEEEGGGGGGDDFYAPAEVLQAVGASVRDPPPPPPPRKLGAPAGPPPAHALAKLAAAAALPPPAAKPSALPPPATASPPTGLLPPPPAGAAKPAHSPAAAAASVAPSTATAASAKARAEAAEEAQIVADEARCNTAHGPGLYEAVRGEPASFTVQACDVTGVAKTDGGDPFSAVLVSADMHMQLGVLDNGDGTHTVHYTPTRAGDFELQVLYADHHIAGSPFHLRVARAPTAASHCLVAGEGLTAAHPHALNTFTIVARDQFDEERLAGGDNFIITVAGGGVAHPIVDLGNGCYTVSYEVDTRHHAYAAALAQAPAVASGAAPVPALALEVHIGLANAGFAYPRPVAGSPFRPHVHIPELHAAVQHAQLSGYHVTAAAPHSPLLQAQAHHVPAHFSPQHAALARATAANAVAAAAHVQQQHLAATVARRPSITQPRGAARVPSASTSSPVLDHYRPLAQQQQQQYQPLHAHVSPVAAAAAAASSPEVLRLRAELEGRERVVDASLAALHEARARLEADRGVVAGQMARMHELGQQVREDSERLADQARQLRAAALSSSSSPNAARGFSPAARSPAAAAAAGVYTSAGGSIAAVDDGFGPAAAPSSPSRYGGHRSGAAAAPEAQPQFSGLQLLGSSSGAAALGASASSSAASPSPAELFDPEVVALFERHQRVLFGLWQFYAGLAAQAAAAAGATPAAEGGGVDARRFVELYTDYDVAPTFLSRRELKHIFAAAARAHGTVLAAAPAAGPDGGREVEGALTYAAFVEALGRSALAALAKPAFSHLYPGARDKVLVLLEMWGLADARKLQEVQRRPRKAPAASRHRHGSPA